MFRPSKQQPRQQKPEVITLSSDSDNETPQPSVVNKSRPIKRHAGVFSRPNARSNSSLVEHRVSVDESGTVRVFTALKKGFGNVNKSADASVATNREAINRRGFLREPSTSVKLTSPIPTSKDKLPIPLSKEKPDKKTNSEEESDDSVEKEKPTKIKCVIEGKNPPLPLIPLGTQRLPTKDFASEMVNSERNAVVVDLYSSGMNATPGPSRQLTMIDMIDVKDLLESYKAVAKDETDRMVADRLAKKLKKIPVDSVEDYQATYKEFTQSVRRKVVNDPAHVHVHLNEFLDEIKSSYKSKKLQQQSQCLESVPSTSKSDCNSSETNSLPAANKLNAKIAVLERRMKIIMMKIGELNEREISVDEMDDDSPYVLAERYEKKLIKMWKYLCKLANRSTDTSRYVDMAYKFEGTHYPEINKAVVKLVRKIKPEFPDFNDILKIVNKCNQKYSLRMRPIDVTDLATEVLKMVVEELQKRRINDFQESLETYLEFNNRKYNRDLPDPAKADPVLKAKLDESKKIGKQKTEEVIAQFCQRQEMREKENPEEVKKEREQGLEIEDDEEDEESDSDSINEEDLMKDIECEVKEEDGIKELPELPVDELPDLPSISSNSEEDVSGDSSDVGDDDDDEGQSSSEKKRKLNDPEDGVSSLKIISVEGAGNLFYTCDRSGRENFSHYKDSAKDNSDDSDVVTLD